jgi:hypothetical protein
MKTKNFNPRHAISRHLELLETRCYIRGPDGYTIEVGQGKPGVAYS